MQGNPFSQQNKFVTPSQTEIQQVVEIQPIIQQPMMQQVAVEMQQPVIQQVAVEMQQPVMQQPVMQQVAVEMQQPMMQQPMMQQPVMQQVAVEMQQPMMQQPVMQQPIIQQPMMQQPMMQQPMMQQPMMQQPMMQQPVTVQPTMTPSVQAIVQPTKTTQQSNTSVTPMFVPTINPGQGLVCQFSPAKFDAFVKVLSVLDDRNIIVITNSSICQSINNGTAILMTDVSVLIDDINNKINLHILNPKKYLKYFKNMKGTSNIFILDDPNNQRYIVTNGDVMVYLPKQIEEFEKDASPPDLSAINVIGKAIDIDKETRNTITTMGSGASHLDILVHQSQMKGVYIPDIAVKSFKEYVSEQIDDTKSELRLRTYAFLSVPGEEYRVTIGELNGNYWMTTFVNTGFITIHILESLQSVSDENLII